MNPNWRSPLMTRLLIFSATLFVFAFFIGKGSSTLLVVLSCLALGFQFVRFAHIFEDIGEPVPPDLSAISFDEASQTFKANSGDEKVEQQSNKMNEAFNATMQSRRERDSDHHLLPFTVRRVGI